MEDFVALVWGSLLSYWWSSIIVSGAFCILLELITSHEKVAWSSRLRGAWFWFVYSLITVTFFAVFNSLWSKLGIAPLVTIDVGVLSRSQYPALHVVSWFVAPIAGGLVGEFFYYWFHRAQHTFRFMWRFHEVHHALREMNGVNSNHHFTEEIFRVPFVLVPMTFFVGVSYGFVPAIIVSIIGLQGRYEHSNTKFQLGWFRYVVSDNRYHRIHHTIHQEDWGHNFGSFVPFWDMVFRTAKFPKKGEWPAVGIPDVDEPKTLRDFLCMPFRKRTGQETFNQRLEPTDAPG
jgi:sterol desaturase/sphingolipid hydroxylase (fatty acid hydroxylase superfamily)